MKFKFATTELEFDRDDAKIAVPLVLLGLAMAFTPLPKLWLVIGAAVYYLFLLFLMEPLTKLVQSVHKKRQYRCPYCRSPYTVMICLDNYIGDSPYYFYRCNDCGGDSVFIDDQLREPGAHKKRKLTTS